MTSYQEWLAANAYAPGPRSGDPMTLEDYERGRRLMEERRRIVNKAIVELDAFGKAMGRLAPYLDGADDWRPEEMAPSYWIGAPGSDVKFRADPDTGGLLFVAGIAT